MHGLKRQLLHKIAIFGALSNATLEFLLEHSAEIGYAPGEYVFREGEPADAIYILASGRAVTLKAWDGELYLLGQLETGDCFGEMALMDMNPRSASVLITENALALKMESHLLLELYQRDLEQFTLFQMNLGREVSRRLRQSDERMFRWRVSMEARDELPKYTGLAAIDGQ